MAYKVLDIYKDLPGTNCGDCGRSGCFAFATAVYLEGESLARCPHLPPGQRARMEALVAGDREQGGGRRPAVSEQALDHLRGEMAGRNLREVAGRCGGRYLSGPPEAVEVRFLGRLHRILRDDVVCPEDPAPSIWVKIFLMIYATRATGRPLSGRWVSYRELPNTVSKARSFEACTEQIARVFEGRPEDLERAARVLGARPADEASAHAAFVFEALPRVPLLLLFWDREEEFPARAVLLLDRHVLDYLDQEALVFLAEAFSERLCRAGGGRSQGELPAS